MRLTAIIGAVVVALSAVVLGGFGRMLLGVGLWGVASNAPAGDEVEMRHEVLLRALETLHVSPEQRLIEDPHALPMLLPEPTPGSPTDPRRLQAQLLRHAPSWAVHAALSAAGCGGVLAQASCRSRFVDDELQLQRASEVRQVVFLGAGPGMRSARAAMPGRTWVVDTRGKHEEAARLLAKAEHARAGRDPVRVEHDVWGEPAGLAGKLGGLGFRGGEPAVIVLEMGADARGGDALQVLLEWLGGLSEATLLMSYPPQDRGGGRCPLGGSAGPGFSRGDVARMIASSGMVVVTHLGAEECESRYLEPVGRRLGWLGGAKATQNYLSARTGM